MTDRQSTSGISATGCSRTVPAAHTSASMPPWRSTMRSIDARDGGLVGHVEDV